MSIVHKLKWFVISYEVIYQLQLLTKSIFETFQIIARYKWNVAPDYLCAALN